MSDGIESERHLQLLNNGPESNGRDMNMLENIPLGIAILEKEGGLKYANRAFFEIMDLDPAQLPDKTDLQTLEAFKAEGIDRYIKRLVTKELEFDLQTPVTSKKSGKKIHIHCRGIFNNDSREPFTILLNDITRHKQMEEQIRLAQKLEAIGKLAGGIAHDFNNILTVIQGSAGMLLSGLERTHPNYGSVQQIYKSAERAESLTRQLLAFSRRQLLQPKVVDLNELVRKIEGKIKQLLGHNIEVITELTHDLGFIKADPTQMEEVLMNLVINARDAMLNSGTLTIETVNVILDENYVKKRPLVEPGPYVMLAVSDSGEGMDENTQAQVFEPFFTTREKGKGTGMGLATVYGIVKQSGGFIWVYSEPDLGTTFKVYLPREGELPKPETPAVEDNTVFRGSETVLVVDDDEEVRSLVTEMLRFYGYKVLEAPGGSNALLIFEKYSESIDLVLTDIVMPQMNGIELVEKLLPGNPSLKVLFMSGFTDNVVGNYDILDKTKNFIQKPFTTNTLIHKLREVLDESS